MQENKKSAGKGRSNNKQKDVLQKQDQTIDESNDSQNTNSTDVQNSTKRERKSYNIN